MMLSDAILDSYNGVFQHLVKLKLLPCGE